MASITVPQINSSDEIAVAINDTLNNVIYDGCTFDGYMEVERMPNTIFHIEFNGEDGYVDVNGRRYTLYATYIRY